MTKQKALALFFSFLIISILFGLAELTTRSLHLKQKNKNYGRYLVKTSSQRNEELRAVYAQKISLLKNYPDFKMGDEVDYSLKFVPNILIERSPTNLAPNIKSRSIAIIKSTKKTIYDVSVSTDKFARRTTPTPSNPVENVLFLGDSFTFGEGVNDNETLPYYFSLRRQRSAVFNIGAPGLGLNDFLYDLEFKNELKFRGIPKRKTIIIYTYMHDHLSRFFCSLDCYREGKDWLTKKPQYDDKLRHLGTFENDHSFRAAIYHFLAKSKFLEFLKINWPLRHSEKQFELFAKAVFKLKNLLQKKYSSEEFYFVFYPRESSLIYANKLIPYFHKYQIKYLIFDNVDYNNVAEGINAIPLDHHPTPIAQFLTAYLLDASLPK